MKRYLTVFGIIWLTAVACFIWGAAMVFYDVFPSRLLKPAFEQITAFVKGHPTDRRPLTQRLRGELAFDPFSLAMDPSPFPMPLTMEPVDASSYRGPAISSLEHARYYSATEREEYFLIYGSFAFEDANWGVILISTRGRVLRAWPMTQKPHAAHSRHLGHIGLALSETGDLVTNTHSTLASYGWCGGKNWEGEDARVEWKQYPDEYGRGRDYGYNGYNYRFHHDITYYEGRFHTFYGFEIVAVDEDTGKIAERIHLVDLIRSARDQGLSIFESGFLLDRELRVDELTATNLLSIVCGDPFHSNKVDVLSRDLADSFDEFETGDLLVSMRKLNLVFVFRPRTSKVLWYRYGLTSRQHDATFQRGYIAVFDNNPFTGSGPSPQIVGLGVQDHTRSVLFELKIWGATMLVRGNFELDEERRLVAFTDDDNGRALVGDPAGKPRFVFENRMRSGKVLPLRNIMRVPARKVEAWNARCD